MLERRYLIDPGAHMLRILDPKTGTVHELRSCYAKNNPALVAQDAFAAFWKDKSGQLLYPFRQSRMICDAHPVFSALMETIPPGRFLFQPGGVVVGFADPEPLQKERFEALGKAAGLAWVRFGAPLNIPPKGECLLIHAGASQTIFALCAGGKPISVKISAHAGIEMDRAIAAMIGRDHHALVFAEDARELKEAASRAFAKGRNPLLSCTVLDNRQGFVRLEMPAMEIWPCIEETEKRIAADARAFLASIGLESMESVLAKPVRLSGGLAQCFGLKETLENALQTEIVIPENPGQALLRAA